MLVLNVFEILLLVVEGFFTGLLGFIIAEFIALIFKGIFKKINPDIIIHLVLTIMSVFCLFNGYKNTMDLYKITNQGKKEIAVITEVKHYEEEVDDETYSWDDIYLTYTVNEKSYNGIIEKAKIHGDIGKKIEIFYYPENPDIFLSIENSKEIILHDFVIGLVLLLFPIIIRIIGKFTSKKKSIHYE